MSIAGEEYDGLSYADTIQPRYNDREEINRVQTANAEVFSEQNKRKENQSNVAAYARALMEEKRLEREIMENGTPEQKAALMEKKRECEQSDGMCTVSGGRRKSRRGKNRQRKTKRGKNRR